MVNGAIMSGMNTPCIIRIFSHADRTPCPCAGHYLTFYDPDSGGGRGEIRTSTRPELALQFPDYGRAHECWTQQSRVMPFRSDGKRNRPLTAFTVEYVPVAEVMP
jgi:hypothetical protein